MKPEFWRDCAFWIFSSLQIRSFLFYRSFLLRTNQNHFPAWPVSLSGLKTPADSLHKSALVSPRPGRLKRCIIPNICILISSVTLTRTPVNKAINQTRVREGSGGERGREGAHRCCVCGCSAVWLGWTFYFRKHQRRMKMEWLKMTLLVSGFPLCAQVSWRSKVGNNRMT